MCLIPRHETYGCCQKFLRHRLRRVLRVGDSISGGVELILMQQQTPRRRCQTSFRRVSAANRSQRDSVRSKPSADSSTSRRARAEGEGETMTRIKAATMALATACLLAGCSAAASQQVPRTEPAPQGEGFIYNVGQGGIEACTAPGRQGECSMVKNVRLMLLSGTWVDGIGSFYKVALPDQTEVWVRGVDLLGLKAKK